MEQKTLLKNKKNQGNGGETMAKRDDSVKKKVPELRFKGFTDDWEQRKLGNESTITAGGDIDKSKLKEVGEYPIFANALTNDGTVGYYDSYYRVEAPAVTVTGRGDVGHAKARKVNFTPVVRLLAVKSNHDVDFLENAINNHKVLVESTGVPQLTAPQLGNYKIFFPTGEEQQKIGSFFKQLDDTITLHQRKLDLLKEQKKGFLQKMFPKHGEKVPELRFAGFADDWEERKFGEVWKKSSERNLNLEYSPKQVLSVAQMKLNPSNRNEQDDYMKTYNVLHKGDIAFEGNKSKSFAFGRFVLNDLQDGIVSHVFNVYRPICKMDTDFMKVYINNESVMKYLLVKATTKTLMMTTLNTKDIVKQKLNLPSLEEQQKIGSFFKQLDDTIALHQRKLDLLKEQKKGFLQKMFV